MAFEILAYQDRDNTYQADLVNQAGEPLQLADTDHLEFHAGNEGPAPLIALTEAATADGSVISVDQVGSATADPPTPAQYTLTVMPDALAGLPAGPLDAEVLVLPARGIPWTADRGVLHVIPAVGG